MSLTDSIAALRAFQRRDLGNGNTDRTAGAAINGHLDIVIEAAESYERMMNSAADIADIIRPDIPKPEEEWVDLVSSNLKRCRYNSATSELDVEFNSGAVWRYGGVPEDIADGLILSKSPGSFFAAEIKGMFTGERLQPRDSDNLRPRPDTRQQLEQSLEQEKP